MNNDYNKSSRYDKRAKRKKTNIILNSLIGVVLLLIIVVSVIIFSGGNNNDVNNATENEQADKNKVEQKDDQAEDANAKDEANENADEENAPESKDTEEENKENVEDEAIVTEGGSDSNVVRTIENPAWEPVGTTQTGEHPSAVYDSSSADWDEMLNAITYATGLDKSSMTVYFLGNNGVNRSVGTVFSPGKEQIYRVYIEWVDGQGWKPTKVEELSSI